MTFKFNASLFAKMLFLDAEIERHRQFGGNKNSDHYYAALQHIRDVQNSGRVPTDEEYAYISPFKSYNSPELGFYNANIHYYLFESNSEYRKDPGYRNDLNRLILAFLDAADPANLLKQLWFPLNFPLEYIRFLEDQFGVEAPRHQCDVSASNHEKVVFDAERLLEFAKTVGGQDEIRIAEKCLEIARLVS